MISVDTYAGPWIFDEAEAAWLRKFVGGGEAARVEFSDSVVVATVWTPRGMRRIYRHDADDARRWADERLSFERIETVDATGRRGPLDDRGKL